MVDELGDQARAVMVGAQALLNQRTADDLHQTLKAMQRLMSVYADTRTGPTAEMTRLMVSLQSVSARLDSTLAEPGAGPDHAEHGQRHGGADRPDHAS